jgi:hypothetical protein
MNRFEFIFKCYDENLEELDSVVVQSVSASAAVGRAGTLCKKNNGPIDVAHTGPEDWSYRYVTTVSPSEYHVKGYTQERLS